MMKQKNIILVACSLATFVATAQNVGIGSTSPLARLHVTDSNVLFSGANAFPPVTSPFSPPIQGAGTRMFWYPAIGAFRAGYVSGSQWDKANIGQLSFATGFSTIASGRMAAAFGAFTTATGDFSTAFGFGTFASGWHSASLGDGTTAKAYNSFTAGRYNDNTDNPDGGNPVSQDRIFQIGNGTDDNSRSNALTILRNGYTGLGNVTNPNAPLQFNNDIQNRKIILYETDNNNHQYYGFGINGAMLRYQTDATGADHVFFAAADANNSNELMRIRGNGNVNVSSSLNVDNTNSNTGSITSTLTFGNNSGEGIGSKRNATGNQYGLDFYTASTNRLSITNGGNTGIGTTTPSEKLEVAGNVKAAGYKFSTPKTYYYSVPPTAFQPGSSRSISSVSTVGAFMELTSPVISPFLAAVNLPNGAVVTGFTAYFYDNSVTTDILFELISTTHGTNGGFILATVQSAGTPFNSNGTDNSITTPLVDNTLRNYNISVRAIGGNWPGFDLTLQSAVITYTLSGVN